MDKEDISNFDPTASVTEQASYWWALLNDVTATHADHQAFGDWVARSPERIEAFLQTARLAKALKSKKLRWPDTPIEVLVREAKIKDNVVSLPSAAPAPGHSGSGISHLIRRRPLLFGTAAALAAIFACTWIFLESPQRYETKVGEQRSVVLNDGSIVTLNTSSAIQITLAKKTRTIRLLSGEALFQVAHDRTRPFDVIVGDTTVRAVGTQFNVDRRANSTTVTVVEGKVEVGSSSGLPPPSPSDGEALEGRKNSPSASGDSVIYLSAGERVTVAPHLRSQPTQANLTTVTAWTQRRLVFEHRPLGEVAEEFNRYNRRAIRIDGAELRSQEVTGVFQANDPGSFMDFISKIPGVKIERGADSTKITAAN